MKRHILKLMPLVASTALIGSLLLAGCQQKMAKQPSYRPDEPCLFFEDGSSSRHPVAGTIARGHLTVDSPLYTGRQTGPDSAGATAGAEPAEPNPPDAKLLAAEAAQFKGVVDEFPFPITRDVVEHGRNRYMIYCVVCHDSTGTGRGKIVERGYTRPPSFHADRLRAAPVGHFFRVATQGYGSMPSYAAQLSARDRWAVVSYIRALQLSQRFPQDKLPEEMRQAWDRTQQVAAQEVPSR